jgi:N-acetylglutamate synthase-like GNAT family acetyltransferase
MTTEQAQQIASLLNTRNQLTQTYTANRVMASAGDYIFEVKDETVVACVQVKMVQWCQCGILHFSVRADREGEGLGSKMLASAEIRAKGLGARIAQCTIRTGNAGSEAVFRKSGFLETCRFKNAATENEVAVFQKAL